MEERASHPLAEALIRAAKTEGVAISDSLFVKDHTFLAGEGVVGVVNGLKVYVGNERLFRRIGIFGTLPALEISTINEWEAMGGTVGFISIEDEGIVGAYCVADAVRPEASQVLEEFKCMGIRMTMLTGDKRDAALAIGKPLGFSDGNIRSELLPEEKLGIVSSAKEDGSGYIDVDDTFKRSAFWGFCGKPSLVLMVGDGINDAPSLAAANVGVAMGAGAALAMETADVTLTDSNLMKLSYSIKTGKRVLQKIEQNILFSLAVKLLVLAFALAGRASLWAAITSDVGAMVLVTLNGMSLLPLRRKSSLSGAESKIEELEAVNERSPLVVRNGSDAYLP